jgi:hypothetical protein
LAHFCGVGHLSLFDRLDLVHLEQNEPQDIIRTNTTITLLTQVLLSISKVLLIKSLIGYTYSL